MIHPREFFWKLAKVKELLRSNNGIICAAKTCVLKSKKGRVTEVHQAIQHLVPVELRMSPDPVNNVPSATDETVPKADDPTR